MFKRNNKSCLIIIISVLIINTILGCSAKEEAPASAPAAEEEQLPTTREVTNLDGDILTIPYEVDRVAALYGCAYEKVALLGAEDKIVLCSGFHKTYWPWLSVMCSRIDEVPTTIAKAKQVNVEELLKIDPDVVFFWTNVDAVEEMQNIGISVVGVYPGEDAVQDLANMKDQVMVYAETLGEAEIKIGREYCDYFDEKLAMITTVTEQIPNSERPRVYCAHGSLMKAQTKYSNTPSLIDKAGGLCVHKELPGTWPADVNYEDFMKWDPEVIILEHSGESSESPRESFISLIEEDGRFDKVSAVKNGEIYVTPMGAFFWDAGSEVILEVMWMAKILHPDKFKDLNIEKEIQEFYSRFYNYKLSDEETDRILKHLGPETTV